MSKAFFRSINSLIIVLVLSKELVIFTIKSPIAMLEDLHDIYIYIYMHIYCYITTILLYTNYIHITMYMA